MGREFELKFQAEPQVLEAISHQYADFHPITMETHYYDTPSRALGRRRWTLRRRLENGVSVCGLKTPGVNDIRGEWETENKDMQAGLKDLCTQDVPQDFPVLLQEGLVEVCGARFTRLACLHTWGSTQVEIALDQGVFLGGGREKPFSEVEVELKAGTRQEAEAFGEALAAQYGLKPETVSKFERALALAQEG